VRPISNSDTLRNGTSQQITKGGFGRPFFFHHSVKALGPKEAVALQQRVLARRNAVLPGKVQPMQNLPGQINKTISPGDPMRPEVAAAADALRATAHRLWFRRVPFAVNGVLKMRWRIKWNKLWEYSRGLAYGDFQSGMRVLDFGGGATIPLFHLAKNGCEVLSLDIDQKLTEHTNAVAQRTGWKLKGSTFDLTQNEAPADWGKFDRVISFCVIEHIPKELQIKTLARLAGMLKPGGLFELTFDFGKDAPVTGAIRSADEVVEMIAATKLTPLGDGKFHDTGERFAIDKKYPDNYFTFGSLFLAKS
jgi:2-polyprenyl-3-methyl-5-hydroxy-6-metoxy-1,4-benzoquinol methylase